MARSPYPPELRAGAVTYAAEHGFDATYERWPGINRATIRSWCSDAGVSTGGGERMRVAREVLHLKWLERASTMADRITPVADLALQRCHEALEANNGRNAKEAALTLAILIDKAQLLSGGQTARIGTDEERDAVVTEARERALRLVN